MLPRGNRLTSGDEIRDVIKRGKRLSSPYFVLHYIPSKQSRFAIVTGRVLGNAVTRNKIKRRITNCVREQLGELPTTINAVFRMRSSALACDFNSLELAVIKAFQEVRQ